MASLGSGDAAGSDAILLEIHGLAGRGKPQRALVRASGLESVTTLPDLGSILPDPSEIAWYYQEYLRFPEGGNGVRGERTALALRQSGVRLAQAIADGAPGPWNLVIDGFRRSAPITIRVTSDNAATDGILHLPWEALEIDGELALIERDVTIDRHVGKESLRPAGPRSGALRVLLVVARPENLSFVDTGSTAGAVVDALEGTTVIEVTLARDGTVDGMAADLYEAHQAGRAFDIVHFDGHGGFLHTEAVLFFEGESGGYEEVSAQVFHKFLSRCGATGAILDACSTAEMTWAGSGFAAQLVRCGLDWVVGMSQVVHAGLTACFLGGFYRGLSQGAKLTIAARMGHRAAFERRLRPGTAGTSAEMEDWFVPRTFAKPGLPTPLPSRWVAGEGQEPTPKRMNVWLADADGPLTHRILRHLSSERVSVLSGLVGSGMPERALELAYWAQHLRVFPGGVQTFDRAGLLPLTRSRERDSNCDRALVVVTDASASDVPALRAWLTRTRKEVHLLVTTSDGDLQLTDVQSTFYPLRPEKMARLVFRRTGIVIQPGTERWLCLEQTAGHVGAVDHLCSMWLRGDEAGSPAFLLECEPGPELLQDLAGRVAETPPGLVDGVAVVAGIGSIASGWYFADACDRVGANWAEVGAWLGRNGLGMRTVRTNRKGGTVVEELSWVHPWLRHVVPLNRHQRGAMLAATVKHANEMAPERWDKDQRWIPDHFGRFLLSILPRAAKLAFDHEEREEAEELSHCLVDQLQDRGMEILAAAVGEWVASRRARVRGTSGNATFWRLEAIERAIAAEPNAALQSVLALLDELGNAESKEALNAQRLHARALVEGPRDLEAAMAALVAAESMARRLQDHELLADLLSDAVLVCQQARRYAEALALADSALNLYVSHGRVEKIPQARCHRAACLIWLNRDLEAVGETTRALAEMSASKNWESKLMALGYRSVALEALSEFPLARNDRQEAVRIHRATGDGKREVSGLAALGLLERAAGDEDAALGWYDKAIERARELGLGSEKIVQLEQWRLQRP